MPDEKEAPVYTAERILHKRMRRGKAEYLIKWKGWATKWNTWEPEKHILDKRLIEDFSDRTRKHSKSKALVRQSVAKRSTSATVNRTRRLQSSSSSSSSSDEPERSDAEKPEVETKEEEEDEEEDSPPVDDKPKFDESIREFLWKPSKDPISDTTITEVTDQAGVTVLIRELTDANSLGTPRFLGYGHAGRGARH